MKVLIQYTKAVSISYSKALCIYMKGKDRFSLRVNIPMILQQKATTCYQSLHTKDRCSHNYYSKNAKQRECAV